MCVDFKHKCGQIVDSHFCLRKVSLHVSASTISIKKERFLSHTTID
jgi:hypothetical protein